MRPVPGADHNDERRRNRVTLAMVAGLMLAIVAGGLLVGNALLGRDENPAAVRPSPTTSATADTRADVERAYRNFLRMVARLDVAPNPVDPEIAARSTGITRATFEKTLTTRKAQGRIVKLGPRDRQTILSTAVDGDTATLKVCHVDHSGTFDAATGAVVHEMTVTTSTTRVTLVRRQGRWKVSDVRRQGAARPGATTCEQ